jgi:hypothetical protein
MQPITKEQAGDFVSSTWEKFKSLAATDKTPEEMRLELASSIAVVGEQLDNVPERWLPPGVREMYRMAVDNPASDEWENVNLWKPVADFLYNLFRLGLTWLEQAKITLEELLAEVVNRVLSWLKQPLGV